MNELLITIGVMTIAITDIIAIGIRISELRRDNRYANEQLEALQAARVNMQLQKEYIEQQSAMNEYHMAVQHPGVSLDKKVQ
jgi:hypothetical protein